MSDFVTPPRSIKPKKAKSISPNKKDSVETSEKINEKYIQLRKPTLDNPFSSQNAKHIEEPRRRIRPPSNSNPFSSSKSKQKQSIQITEDEKKFEEAKEAFKNIYESSHNPDYDIESDPNYKIFDTWANTIKGDTDIEKGLTIKKKNNEPPSLDELEYIKEIIPYLIAYNIHCKTFSTTQEQLNKCYKMYITIKKLINKFRDHDIKFFRGDRPNEEIINMVHFPLKKTKKAYSLEKIKKSKSIKKQRTHSLGGKKRKTSKNRK